MKTEINLAITRITRKWISKLKEFEIVTQELMELKPVKFVDLDKPTTEELMEQKKREEILNYISTCNDEVKQEFKEGIKFMIVKILQEIINSMEG